MKSGQKFEVFRFFVASIFFGSVTFIGCSHHDRNANYVDDQPGGQFGDVVSQRASFDLSCPRDQIAVQEIGGDSFGATGCGQKASYTCICMYHVWTTCTKPLCQMDSHSRAAPSATSAAPAPAITYSAPTPAQ
jgi:hypothetical protein